MVFGLILIQPNFEFMSSECVKNINLTNKGNVVKQKIRRFRLCEYQIINYNKIQTG